MNLKIILKCGFDFDFIYPLRINDEIKYKQNIFACVCVCGVCVCV